MVQHAQYSSILHRFPHWFWLAELKIMGYFIIKIRQNFFLVTCRFEIEQICCPWTFCLGISTFCLGITPIFTKLKNFIFAPFEFLLQLMKDLRLPFSDENTDKHLLISFVLTSDDKHGLASYFLPRHLLISTITVETNLSATLVVHIVNLRISNWCPVN